MSHVFYNYKRCLKCGKRLFEGKNHLCMPRISKLRIKFKMGFRGGINPLRSYVKDEYVGKVFNIEVANRTAIVRLFMDALRVCRANDSQKAKSIRRFLKRFHLSNAEIHSILFHIGFRYSVSDKYAQGNPKLRNIKINGYYDHKARSR